MSAAELAARERIRPQSLTRLVAQLEQSGYIKRRDDESDGRRVLIDITTSGKDVLIRDVRQRDAWLALAISTELTATEQELLRLAAQLMEKLADAQGAPALRRAMAEPRSKTADGSAPVPVRQRKAHP